MSDEYDEVESSSVRYSSFWPLIILLSGLLLWSGYQVFAANSQRNVYNAEFQNAIPTINAAENVQAKYVALMKDLIQTSAKDPYAAQIVKEATQAGLLHVNPSETNSTATPAAAPINSSK